MRKIRSIPSPGNPEYASRSRSLLARIVAFAAVIGTGVLLGSQIVNPTKRIIEAVAGLLLIYILWNYSTLQALWFLLVIYPFPFAVSVGTSDFILVVVVFSVYMLRVATHRSTFHLDRRFDLPIALLLGAYVISFYNETLTEWNMRFALIDTMNLFAAVLFFYMIINFVDDEEKLERTTKIALVSAALVITFTVIEMLFPGRTIIPSWLYTEHKAQLIMKGVRMTGPFHDYELTAEFFAMHVPLILLMLVRARGLLERNLFALLFLVDIVMLFSTVTRGAFVSLSIGLIYMAWVCRRDLTIIRFISIASALVALALIVDTFVARYTVSGSLFERLFKTTFERGFIPDTRTHVWTQAVEIAMKHPIIGHGPGWEMTKGLRVALWPHNAYLYIFSITGIVGLGAFLFLLTRLMLASIPRRKSSIVTAPFAEALQRVLHVMLVMFLIDQIKIDYPRNQIYTYFVWFFFGLIAISSGIVENTKRARVASSPPAEAASIEPRAILTR